MPTNKTKTKKGVAPPAGVARRAGVARPAPAKKTKKAAPAKKAPAGKAIKAAPAKAVATRAAKKPAVKSSPASAGAAPKNVCSIRKHKGKINFKKEAVKKLLAAKSKILQEVTQKVRSESDTQKFEIGDIYDVASNERERELSLTLGDRDREKLADIEDALERIRVNTYGECEECGEPIAEDRLMALPFTRVCVECQSRTEKEQRIKGKFEEETGLGILEKSEDEEEF